MKFIVLVVFSVKLFMASCRERPDGRELNNDGRNLSDGSNLHDDFSNRGDQYYGSDLPKGPKDESSTVEPEHFSGGPLDDISSTDEPEHFSGGPLDGVSSTDVDMGDSSDIDHQLKEDGTIQNELKLRGGSKCKSDIMCSLLGGSCVSNSTYCSGRELPSVCGGPKCKCCITVNLEVKMHDLETELRSMVVNLTIANSNLNTKLESMMNFMISSNSSQATVNSNLDQKINSIMTTNSNLTNELQFINENLTIANANQNSMIDSIREHQGCPEGLFLFTPSNQCFRLLNDTRRTYDSAKAACTALGLQLAQPYESISLRIYLLTKYDLNQATWIGARGDGSNIKWERTGHAITTGSPLWWPQHPGGYVTTGHGLVLMTHEAWWKGNPKLPYYSSVSSTPRWSLCEHVME